MALPVDSDTMGESRILTARAPADSLDRQRAAGRPNSLRNIECKSPGRCRRHDPRRVAADPAGDEIELGDSELVAAGPDRRAEHGDDDRFGERTDRGLNHPCREPTPTGMDHRQLGACADQHHRGAVADPTSEHDILEVGQCNVTRLPVVGARCIDPNHRRAMDLVELGPGQIDELTTTRFELCERHRDPVEIAIVDRRTLDVYTTPGRRRQRDRGGDDPTT